MTVVVGIGARAAAALSDLEAAVDVALGLAGVSAADVAAVATLDRRASLLEPFARRRSWPLVVFPPERLAMVAVPRPSARVAAAVGVPSVAEAAALAAAGPGARLLVPKEVLHGVTVAIAAAGRG
ncbi:cobalamin biosynthesis protein [Actinoplanes sp. NPDC049548]|uniref:cobalamin biosynthesis protein n=1 Tax=Actinoplanes sp. NPDC049548 TaxID=3155152 RepID=UPI0034321F8D